MVQPPCAVAIVGARGSGKSALGYYLLELLHDQYGAPGAVLGLPADRAPLLPPWLEVVETPDDARDGTAILVDEGALQFHARRSHAEGNLTMDRVLSLSRQRAQTIIIATHTLRKLDVALVADMNVLAFRRPSLLHARFERAELRQFTALAAEAFRSVPAGEDRRLTYVVAEAYEGLLENPLPSFWCGDLSTGWAAHGRSPYARLFTDVGVALTAAELERFGTEPACAPLRAFADKHGTLSKYQAGIVVRILRGEPTQQMVLAKWPSPV